MAYAEPPGTRTMGSRRPCDHRGLSSNSRVRHGFGQRSDPVLSKRPRRRTRERAYEANSPSWVTDDARDDGHATAILPLDLRRRLPCVIFVADRNREPA